MDPNIPTKGFLTNVRYMFDLRDVVIDVQVCNYNSNMFNCARDRCK